jgi:hypothetical protein
MEKYEPAYYITYLFNEDIAASQVESPSNVV